MTIRSTLLKKQKFYAFRLITGVDINIPALKIEIEAADQ
jgi:hypothetical protein